MHAAALIHDDYIYNDVLRRGKPTFHMTVNKKKRKSRAIAAGNTLFGLSMEVLTNADFSEEIKLAAVKKYSKSALLTGFGEAMDVYHSYSFTPGKVIIEKILRLKTAQYTLSGPLTLGSLLAKGTSHEQKTLNEIGDNIGIAFQLADDILGATGPAEIGKDIGSDFREGKPTLFLQEAWKKMSLSEKLQARRLMQKSHLSDADISKLRKSVVSKINLGEMDHMTKRYANTAKSMIKKLEVKDDIKHDLLLVAEFATQRKL
jgi:geranylgeranyl diphosphate synthase type I